MRHILKSPKNMHFHARESVLCMALSAFILLIMSVYIQPVRAQDAQTTSEDTPTETQVKRKKTNAEKKNKQTETKSTTPKEDKQFPIKTAWIVSSFQGKNFGVDRPTFVLDDNYRAKGFGGCNTYSATAYPLRGQGFGVGPIALTKKTCDKNTMDLEKAFLIVLRSSEKWDLVEGSLVLSGSKGSIKLERSF